MASKKKKKPTSTTPKRPKITHGGKQIDIPILSGPVGPDDPQLKQKYPTYNAPNDVAIVTEYFEVLEESDLLGFVADLRPVRVTVIGQPAVPKPLGPMDHLCNCIAKFHRKYTVNDTEEVQNRMIKPDGETWLLIVEQVDYLLADPEFAFGYGHAKYIFRGTFDKEKITQGYKDMFEKDRAYRASFVPQFLDLVSRLERDPYIYDIRWMAYALATVAIEVRLPEIDAKGRWGDWTLRWWPVEEVKKGAKKVYGPTVKIARLPDGSARVTEQDGDQWTVSTTGKLEKVNKSASPGSTPGGTISKTYKDDDGTELSFFGRGYVQLTWWSNYAAAGIQLRRGLEFLFNPDLVLQPEVAYALFSHGMRTGAGFANGRKFGDFFYGDKTDYVNARTMVNGHDRAEDIAKIAEGFEKILLDARIR